MSLLAKASFSSANGKSIGKSKSRPRGVTSKPVTALGCCRDRLLLAELPGLLSAVISGGTDAHLSGDHAGVCGHTAGIGIDSGAGQTPRSSVRPKRRPRARARGNAISLARNGWHGTGRDGLHGHGGSRRSQHRKGAILSHCVSMTYGWLPGRPGICAKWPLVREKGSLRACREMSPACPKAIFRNFSAACLRVSGQGARLVN